MSSTSSPVKAAAAAAAAAPAAPAPVSPAKPVSDAVAGTKRTADEAVESSSPVPADTEPAAASAADGSKKGNKKAKKHRVRGAGVKDYNSRRGDTGPAEPAREFTAEEIEERKARRIGAKRKVAVLMGFCGTGYQGMQVNPGSKTIESDLFAAFIQARMVSEDNAQDLKKIGFQRAARTDKGVHAAGQVVNARLVVDHLDDPVAAINAHLPAQIRVWDVVRVQNSFNSKNHCDGRIYEYILPTYILEPMAGWAARLASARPEGPDNPYQAPEFDLAAIPVNRDYRLPAAQLAALRDILAGFTGTNNHHNFTIGKSAKDPSCQRYITQFTASDPETYYWIDAATGEKHACGEWVSLKVHGQSFMLHQIRKMVGLAIMLLKTGTPRDAVQPALLTGDVKVNVPKAPGLGLLLEQCVFSVYNKKAADQDREQIDFGSHSAEIDAFKRQFIYSKIVQEENETKCFQVWVEHLMRYPYAFRYLSAAGIPADYSAAAHLPGEAVAEEEADGDGDGFD
ncbi:tRNA pseudouridine synthase 1 [Blastocladiella emersonii ATCC 22665]|nr:tRNA pseudouridine synthase 1 [Blastocladiella emersonii ATCC 22665]